MLLLLRFGDEVQSTAAGLFTCHFAEALLCEMVEEHLLRFSKVRPEFGWRVPFAEPVGGIETNRAALLRLRHGPNGRMIAVRL